MSKKIGKTHNPNGVNIKYHPNGNIMSKTPYVNDKPHGLAILWWENGTKKSETMWKHGKQHGLSTSWRDDGKKNWLRMWSNDKRHGLEVYWFSGISPEEWQTYYRHGKTYGEIEWDDEGIVSKSEFSTLIAAPCQNTKQKTIPNAQ